MIDVALLSDLDRAHATDNEDSLSRCIVEQIIAMVGDRKVRDTSSMLK